MNVMVAVIFLCTVLGLVARRIGTREQLAIVLIAVTMSGLYFFMRRLM